MLHRLVSRCLFPNHRYGHYSWHGVMCYLWQGEHWYAGTQTNLLHSLVTYNWPESPHLAQHVPPVVVNIICYQWWDESVVASPRLRLSRHNLIKLLPATPRGISLYIIQATEVSLKLKNFFISIFLSIRDHKMNVLRYFLASASQGSVLSWYWVQILFIIIN